MKTEGRSEMMATRINAVSVEQAHTLPTGARVLLVGCSDLDRFAELPDAVRFDDEVYGKTGWNSDTGFAYFRTDARVAFAAVGGAR